MGDRPDLGEERNVGLPGAGDVDEEGDAPFLIARPRKGLAPAILGGAAARDIVLGDLGNRPIVVGLPGLQQALPVTNVRDYGARGDGTSDDTDAIQEALNRTGDGGIVYFPFGEYPVQGLHLLERRCLSLLGEGRCSLLRRLGSDGTTGILHAVGCVDLRITRLGFDANGLEPRDAVDRENGILRFQRCQGVDIVETVVLDSAPPRIPEYTGNFITDQWRTGFLFDHIETSVETQFEADTELPNRDVRVLSNTLIDLGILVRNARRVRIENNSFRLTSGYAVLVGGRGDGISSLDIVINSNEIMDPLVGGIAVVASSAIVRAEPVPAMVSRIDVIRIRVTNNTILKSARPDAAALLGFAHEDPRTSPDGHGVFVGLAEEALPGMVRDGGGFANPVEDVVFRDVLVDSNHIEFARERSWPTRDAFGIVFAYKGIEWDAFWNDHVDDLSGRYANGPFSSAAKAPRAGTPYFHTSIGFFHAVVSRNTVLGCRAAGIRVQRLCRSVVRDNLIEDCTAGIHLELPYFCLVTGNHAITTGNVPYRIAEPIFFNSLIGNYAAPTSVRMDGAFEDVYAWPDARWTVSRTPLQGGNVQNEFATHAGDEPRD